MVFMSLSMVYQWFFLQLFLSTNPLINSNINCICFVMILPDMTQMLASAWKSKPKKDAKNVSRMLVHLSSMVRPSYSQLSHETITIPSQPNMARAESCQHSVLSCTSVCHPRKKLGFNGRSWENLGKSLGKKGAKIMAKKEETWDWLGGHRFIQGLIQVFSLNYSYLYRNFASIPDTYTI